MGHLLGGIFAFTSVGAKPVHIRPGAPRAGMQDLISGQVKVLISICADQRAGGGRAHHSPPPPAKRSRCCRTCRPSPRSGCPNCKGFLASTAWRRRGGAAGGEDGSSRARPSLAAAKRRPQRCAASRGARAARVMASNPRSTATSMKKRRSTCWTPVVTQSSIKVEAVAQGVRAFSPASAAISRSEQAAESTKRTLTSREGYGNPSSARSSIPWQQRVDEAARSPCARHTGELSLDDLGRRPPAWRGERLIGFSGAGAELLHGVGNHERRRRGNATTARRGRHGCRRAHRRR